MRLVMTSGLVLILMLLTVAIPNTVVLTAKKEPHGDTTTKPTNDQGASPQDNNPPQNNPPDNNPPQNNPPDNNPPQNNPPDNNLPQNNPPPQQEPPKPPTRIGQLNEQTCVGVVAAFECNLNVNNIHKTTIREGGGSVVVGQPASTPSGATPVILYIQGVGYVEVTGVQNAGSGQATISYVVLVPAK